MFTLRFIPATLDTAESYLERQIAMAQALKTLQNNIKNLFTDEDFEAWKITYNLEQAAQKGDWLRADKALKNWVISELTNIEVGNIKILDPSTGLYLSSDESLSNTYNDLRYYAFTFDQWEDFTALKTWDEFDALTNGYTVRQLDLFANYLDDFGNIKNPQ